VGDFRVADIAAGGQGAPLTPIVNAIIFGEKGKKIGVLNIGGIANVTVLTPFRSGHKIFGCDTGPGNMLIDYLSKRMFGIEYDESGRLATCGIADNFIINKILSSRFFTVRGPKSTGREAFGQDFGKEFFAIGRKKGLSKYDIMATASMLTVSAFRLCCGVNNLHFDKLVLTGGGAKNLFFINAIDNVFPHLNLVNSFDYGFPSDYLEAVSFAVLANEAICSNRYNLKTVTGANKAVVLGKICQP
jgi:anhydro-N-acetylmuramic acid kinase